MKISTEHGPTLANRIVIALRWVAALLASDAAMVYTDPHISVERRVTSCGDDAPLLRIRVYEPGNEGDVRGAVMAWLEAVQTHAGAVTATLTEKADQYDAVITVKFGDPELPVVEIASSISDLGGRRRVVELDYNPLLPTLPRPAA